MPHPEFSSVLETADRDLAEIIPKAKILPVDCADDLKSRKGDRDLCPVCCWEYHMKERRGGALSCWSEVRLGAAEARWGEGAAVAPSAEHQRAQTL